ncbi:flippase [Candidatus Woesearchaeota archaeon]|nr:flippase [Candidatus Woesearchaeota archaeon]
MSDSTTIAKNTLVLFAGELVAHALGFLITIVLARTLGDAGFGTYSFAFAIAQLGIIFTDLGMSTLMVRDASKDNKKLRYYSKNVFWLKSILSITVFVTLGFIMYETYKPVLVPVLLATIAMIFLELGFFFRKFFNIFQKLEYEALVKVSEKIITFLLLLLLFVFHKYTIVSVISIFVISYAITLIIVLFCVHRFISIDNLLRHTFNTVSLKDLNKFYQTKRYIFLQFGLATVFAIIYFRIDTVMLFYMLGSGAEAVGWYNAAYKLIDGLNFIPTLFIAAIFPAMSFLYTKNNQYLQIVYQKSIYYLLLLAIPIGVGVSLLSARFILIFYGSEYLNAVFALQILIWAEVFVFVNYFTGFLLNSIEKQKLFTITVFIGLAFNVALNLFLIPIYGIYGAAAATLATEILNFIMLYIFSRNNGYSFSLIKTIYKPVAAALVMAAAIYASLSLHIIAIIPLAAAVYVAALVLLKGIGKGEFDLFLRAIAKLRKKT